MSSLLVTLSWPYEGTGMEPPLTFQPNFQTQLEKGRQKCPVGLSKLPCHVYSFLVRMPTILHVTRGGPVQEPSVKYELP